MNFGPANNEANKENVDPHPRPQRKYSFESLKQTIYKKFESLTRSSHKHHSPSSSSNSLRESLLSGLSLDEMHFRPSFNVFQPSLVNTIEVPANIGFNYGANVYNQKNNMIITCPSNSHVHFYDASSFAPLKKRSKRTIDSSVVQMSYCDETDTHLMGCAFGDIYSYNATSNTLNKVMKQGDSFVLGITYITPNLFAFSSSRSNMLYFGDVNSKKAEPHYSLDSDAWYLHNIKEKNLLLSGLANGMIAIYNTKKAPKYPMVDSLQAHRFGKYVTSIINITIKGRDYLITGGNDHTVKIWHFYKGKMRLLKNITTVDDVSTIVYLEEYKMIATTHHKDFVKFFRVPSGALVSTLPLGLYKARNIFLMPDKNLLGVADLSKNVIKVVQLHPNAAAQSR